MLLALRLGNRETVAALLEYSSRSGTGLETRERLLLFLEREHFYGNRRD